MVRDGYSRLTVTEETKERFDAAQPPSVTQDEFVTLLLDLDEDVISPDEAEQRIPEDQYADLVDDITARVERRVMQAMREHSGF